MEGLTLFRAVLTVIIVLLMAWWCSRLLGRQWGQFSGSGNIRLVGQLQVGRDRSILLVKVGEDHFLVGVSPAGIQLLSKVDGEFEEGSSSEPSAGMSLSFQELLKKQLGRTGKKGGDRDE